MRDVLGWQPASWLSASVVAFLVAAAATLAVAPLDRRLTSAPSRVDR